MKITIAGAAGDVGKRIVNEALRRGHHVTGVVRTEEQFGQVPATAARTAADIADPGQVALLAGGQDLLISAVRPPDGQEAELAELTRALLEGAADARVRILLVGGAARLRMPDSDETILTAGALPQSVIAIAHACQVQYELCRTDTRADWTYVSPPMILEPGERTGCYRVGGNTLLVGQDGVSCISTEDFAVALLDEAETPRHRRQAFTVAY